MELVHRDKRDNLVYDPQIKGYDAAFWSTLSGSPTIAGGKIRFNNASAASFILFEFTEIAEFIVNVPASPTSGDSRRWGLYSPAASANIGALYFDITGTVFSAKVIDANGQTQTTTLTWNGSWNTVDTSFKIAWEPDRVQFWAGGSIVATFAVISAATAKSIPFIAMPLYIKNGNADNMDVAYVDIRHAAGMV